ncbi:MAG TPA: hypothetical protein PLY87_24100, partial [Planctomycetaceae bacterium]|nr:hypothetical protein [Planctomycetaceae bacterium]
MLKRWSLNAGVCGVVARSSNGNCINWGEGSPVIFEDLQRVDSLFGQALEFGQDVQAVPHCTKICKIRQIPVLSVPVSGFSISDLVS